MAVSYSTSNLPTLPNLYCNEAPSEVLVSRELADHDDNDCEVVTFAPSSSSSDFDSLFDYDGDNSLINMFDSEVVQSNVLSRFHALPDYIVTARQEAVQWILKAHSFYKFRPETAYLSINYLDRFLSATASPQGKRWCMQLLSVACLSLAAKMEETTVPFLLDLQIMKPRFLFKPKTVQRMELLVMHTLKWRLRTVTPFDFLHSFIARLSCVINQHSMCHIFSIASDLITSTCQDIDSLDYPPSAVAAAVALWLTSQELTHLGCLHNRVNKEIVKKIYKIIQGKMCDLEPLQPSSCTGVFDAAIQRNCKLDKKIGNKNIFNSSNNVNNSLPIISADGAPS